MSPFGPEFGKKYFCFREGLVNLNHGSFGAVAKPVFEAQKAILEKVHGFPDLYYRTILDGVNPRLQLRTKLAEIVDSDVDDLVCVMSATTAFNAVFRSYPFEKGDKVMFMGSIYLNDLNTLRYLASTRGIELVEFPVDYPREPEPAFLTRYRSMLREHKPKISIFDTVSSMPSDVFPWERMCDICREEDVLSFVDGAHGVGLLHISLKSAKPTFFCSNLHKWFYVGQGACVFYVDSAQHSMVKGFPIAAFDPLNVDDPKILAKTFGYSSTMDYSAIDSVLAAIEFNKEWGYSNILEYQNGLSSQAHSFVCKTLETEPLGGSEAVCALFTVKCPVQPENKAEFVQYVCKRLMEKWNTFIPVAQYQGILYIRFSATIYLDMTSFEYGVRALKECFAAYDEER